MQELNPNTTTTIIREVFPSLLSACGVTVVVLLTQSEPNTTKLDFYPISSPTDHQRETLLGTMLPKLCTDLSHSAGKQEVIGA